MADERPWRQVANAQPERSAADARPARPVEIKRSWRTAPTIDMDVAFVQTTVDGLMYAPRWTSRRLLREAREATCRILQRLQAEIAVREVGRRGQTALH